MSENKHWSQTSPKQSNHVFWVFLTAVHGQDTQTCLVRIFFPLPSLCDVSLEAGRLLWEPSEARSSGDLRTRPINADMLCITQINTYGHFLRPPHNNLLQWAFQKHPWLGGISFYTVVWAFWKFPHRREWLFYFRLSFRTSSYWSSARPSRLV